MAKLDENFFFFFLDHLGKITTLSIKAPGERSLGLWGREPYHTPPRFTFGPDTLNLENIYACPELIDFLVGYKGILEELTLRDYRSKLFTSPSPPAA